METIPKADCLKIGYIQKPHGIKGEVVLNFEPEYGDSLEDYPTLFLEIDGLLVPFFLRDEENALRFRSGETAIVHFDWVDDEYQAKKICGHSAYILREDWVKEEDELTLHMLVGYTLFDAKIGKIGPITQVDDFAGNLLFTVEYNGQTVMVPYNEDFLERLDEESKEIELECPEGIFDL